MDRFDRAFDRAAGAPLTKNNAVHLLLDARENFPAWLAAIAAAKRYVLFESYIIADDGVGHEFIEALAAKAREGVRVCVVYDWLGSTKFSRPWEPLREAGADVRCFNPPSVESPLAWLTRDHRKSIVVDGEVAFVSGLCVSSIWEGDPARRLEPWRDTGVEVRGDAVADIEAAFAQVWHACGGHPLRLVPGSPRSAGDVRVRVIAGVPNSAATYRTDLLVASLAREHLWLTDAYFVATSAYTQALRAAARDGVDVRLLVPGASDIPPFRRSPARAIARCWRRACACSSGTARCSTRRPRSRIADGRAWARPISISRAGSRTTNSTSRSRTRRSPSHGSQYERDLGARHGDRADSRNRVRRSEPRAPRRRKPAAQRAPRDVRKRGPRRGRRGERR